MRAWTTHEERELRRLYAGGVTVREIADRLGRSQSAIHNRIGALGVRRPRVRRVEPLDDVPLSASEYELLQAQVLADLALRRQRARGSA